MEVPSVKEEDTALPKFCLLLLEEEKIALPYYPIFLLST